MIEKTIFNFKPLDDLLGGGIEHGVITNFYGEAGSGKSNLCLLVAIRTIENKGNVIFIDTEGSFSPERLHQLTEDSENFLEKIKIIEPIDFEDQHKIISSLSKQIIPETKLIVIDSLVALYRIASNQENYDERNRQLAFQMAELSRIARENRIPIAITTQVYSSFNNNNIEIVSRDVAKYWSKCLVKLEKGHRNERIATLTKHRSRPEGISCKFRIVEKGLEEMKGGKLF